MVELATIKTEGISPSARGKDVPRNKWKFLLSARASYCSKQFQHDCRELLLFIDDGRENGFFGYPDEVTYWREGLSLEPEAVPFAENYLRTRKARLEAGMGGRDWREVPFNEAVILGKRGRPKKGEEKGGVATFSASQRNTKAHILARLDRDGHHELAAKVRAGKLSANAAAIEAEFRKRSTPLERIQKLWSKLDRADREAHWSWMLKHCVTCGRSCADHGTCDACADEWFQKTFGEESRQKPAVTS